MKKWEGVPLYTPDESTEPEIRNQKKKSHLLTFFLLLLTVLLVASLVFIKSKNVNYEDISLENILNGKLAATLAKQPEPQNISINYDSTEEPGFTVYKGLLIKSDKDTVRAFNAKGEMEWSLMVSVGKPQVEANRSGLLIADMGGRNIYMVQGGKVSWTHKMSGSIFRADISEDGYISVVHKEPLCTAAVTVFNSQGKELFTRGLADNFVLSAKVSPSKKKVLFNTVDILGISSSTVLELFDTLSGEPVGTVKREDTLYPFVWFMQDDMIAAVNEKEIAFFTYTESKDTEKNTFTVKWNDEAKNAVITGAELFKEKYLAAAYLSNGSKGVFTGASTAVRLYDANGKLHGECSLDFGVKSLQTYGNRLGAVGVRKVAWINASGECEGTYTASRDIVNVYFLTENTAAVVDKTHITFIHI